MTTTDRAPLKFCGRARRLRWRWESDPWSSARVKTPESLRRLWVRKVLSEKGEGLVSLITIPFEHVVAKVAKMWHHLQPTSISLSSYLSLYLLHPLLFRFALHPSFLMDYQRSNLLPKNRLGVSGNLLITLSLPSTYTHTFTYCQAPANLIRLTLQTHDLANLPSNVSRKRRRRKSGENDKRQPFFE